MQVVDRIPPNSEFGGTQTHTHSSGRAAYFFGGLGKLMIKLDWTWSRRPQPGRVDPTHAVVRLQSSAAFESAHRW